MKFQAFHVNPGEKLKKKDVNNDLSNFMSVFPNKYLGYKKRSGPQNGAFLRQIVITNKNENPTNFTQNF